VTDDSKKKNIAIELARGAEALEEATILLDAAKYAGAVSRAYYATFHYAQALLLTLGEEPRTHGLERLLHRDFVRPGKLDANVALRLSRLMKLRQDADYAAEIVITAETAKDEVASARVFLDAVRAILVADGWTS
jgi:uncharacterized protein (UPF0332 family)